MTGRVINAQTGQEIHEEPDPAAWQVPGGILGFGAVTRAAAGVMTGSATFAVRGGRSVDLQRSGDTATVRVGTDTGTIAPSTPTHIWSGPIVIEGYPMAVSVDIKSGKVTFCDT